MEFVVDNAWVRGVASWQPVTKLGGKDLSTFSCIAIWVTDNTVTAMVTDKFRMVFSRVEVSVYAPNEDGTPYLIPMDVFARFVTANKGAPDRRVVMVQVTDGTITVSDEVSGVSVSDKQPGNTYPKILDWVDNWQPAKQIENNAYWNMVLLADVYKFADPADGVPTAAKRDVAWNVTGGDSEVHSSAFRFDKGSPETFAVWVMPMKRPVR